VRMPINGHGPARGGRARVGRYLCPVPRRIDPDEGPSEDDLDRFGEDVPASDARCPDCGTPVWSEADVCPKCYAFLGGEVADGPAARARRRLRITVVVLLVIGLLTAAGIPILQSLLRR